MGKRNPELNGSGMGRAVEKVLDFVPLATIRLGSWAQLGRGKKSISFGAGRKNGLFRRNVGRNQRPRLRKRGKVVAGVMSNLKNGFK